MSTTDPAAALRGLARDDQMFLGVGLLTFIFTFIDFAHVKVSAFGTSATGANITAWHGIGTLAALLVLLAIVVGAVAALAPTALQALPVSGRVIATGAAVLAFVFFIIRWLTLPDYNFGGLHAGYNLYWGGYVTLVLTLVMIAIGLRAIRAAGETLPWEGRTTPPAATPPAY